MTGYTSTHPIKIKESKSDLMVKIKVSKVHFVYVHSTVKFAYVSYRSVKMMIT